MFLHILGFYCPPASFSPVPCPRGTYGPNAGAVSQESCLKCPPQHYCPRPGLLSPLACGPMAVQPLSGQDLCICSGNGQSFQVFLPMFVVQVFLQGIKISTAIPTE